MRIIRQSLYALLFALIALPGSAQTVSDQIEGVIGAQIEAFRADDFATAFSFASPNIKQMFGDADRFGVMVRQGYPMVWRPDQVTFLELQDVGGRMWQEVLIRDPSGVFHRLEYQMIDGPDGWRINGVRILEAPQIGT
jgi:hypothetical protein